MTQPTVSGAEVVIGVTTFRRPQMLEDALRAVEALMVGEDKVSVLVAENDAINREGAQLVEGLRQAAYRFPIQALVVDKRGFTHGRNAILEEAFLHRGARFVAMMDDDQLPDPEWLVEMRREQQQTRANVVGPAVWPLFESTVPKWVASARIYNRDTHTTGPVDRLYGDGGVLFEDAAFRSLRPPYYDHSFALTGGADSDLFRRMQQHGVTFARAAAARINERYPSSRLALDWAMRRAFRIGNVDVLINIKSQGRLRTALIEFPKIIGALLLTPLALIASIGRSGAAVDALCRAARAGGKTVAFLGSAYEEYKVTHGH